MGNKFRLLGIFLTLLFTLVAIIGCDDETFAGNGDITFTLENEAYTIDAEFYVFHGIMPGEGDEGSFFFQVSWEQLDNAGWTHTIELMNVGDWNVDVYALESGATTLEDPSTYDIARSQLDIEFSLASGEDKQVSVDLSGSDEAVSIAGDTGGVTFTIPPAEQEGSDEYYFIHGEFYWDDDDSEAGQWDAAEIADVNVDIAAGFGDVNIDLETPVIAAGRWYFTVGALDVDPNTADTMVPTRTQTFMYLKVQESDTSQTVIVDLEVPSSGE